MILIIQIMTIEQTLQKEIEDFKTWCDRENEISPYKSYVKRRIELINWVLENMKNPEVILKINQTHDIFEDDKVQTELRILDRIFYQVCSNEIK